MATLPNLFDLYFCSCRLRGGAKFPQCLSLIALGFTDQPASSELQILQDLKGLWGPAVLQSVSPGHLSRTMQFLSPLLYCRWIAER